ncbi:flavodoxin reductase family protein [Aequorivita sublithincola DSM 14238]|uniref:Flavodoxin reductase family protein n=1 Tax=Aequorivita sublithincola (strain DSM 14238 / LMG 21431 / ACAM 643 / 9-3) TaxID=746697 RepID=I3YUL0_AEQSU|nr:ferredoxin--NADP reductase [Aequorivita sublithincola]AFL80678.1 flavodoxin reductase family protein [Aequorivita sublithincola DSM 14238]
MSEFHALTVSEVKKESPNSVSISFQVPENLKGDFAFQAGQYITIKHNSDGKELRRAYSICSSPKSGILKVAVKKVEKGAFSEYANKDLKAGDTLQVMPPTGKFVLEPNINNYAAFAAGSGITPVLSLIKSTLEEMPQSTFLLVYGNKNVEETMFYNEILELQKQFPNRFAAEFVFSRKEEENAKFGRIDRSIVNFFLKNKYIETTYDAFYLCGPEEMIDEVSATLKNNGINTKQIHHELFSTAEKGLLVEKHDGFTSVTVFLDDEEEVFEMPQTKSILEAALDEGLDPPYSCQGGICSTCIARLKEGKAEMRKNQILTEAEIADGLILTCQAHPTTAKVVVDYDDV